MSPPGVILRPMRPDDISAVRDLAAALPTAPQWPAAAYLDAIDAEAIPRRIALLAVDSAEGVLGFTVAAAVPPQAELETIAVSPDFQRRGLARRLLTVLSAELHGLGVTEVTLEVRASNAPARTLYASLGFAEAGRRTRYYADPEEDAVILTLPLT